MNTLENLKQTTGGKLTMAPGCARNPDATWLGPVAVDSRQIEPGDVFWALDGPKHRGSDYAGEAFARGAAGAVVPRPIDLPGDGWVLEVDDTHEALERWAARRRAEFAGTAIAVTGSVGKTTTRQMIHTVLRTRLSGTASPRNYNNHVGLPVSMTLMEPAHDYAVLELGASGRGEIAGLADLCAPKIGVITHVADAHLAGFGSRTGVAEAKAELLAALPSDGHAVLCDDPLLRRMAPQCEAAITWVGRGGECDVSAEAIRSQGGRLSFRVEGCEFHVPVWGRHHLSAALAAVAVGRLLGFSLEETAAALEGFEPVPMRCEVLQRRGATVINDTYNANPASMQAALELLRDFDAPGRRVIVAGDMGELGDQSERMHHELGTRVVTNCGADLLLACGEWAYEVVSGARAAGMPRSRSIPCRTPEDALPIIGQMIQPGDVVLVKGSRHLAMERIIDALEVYPRRRSA